MNMRFAVWSLVAGGILYMLFYGPGAAGLGPGDEYWILTLSLHAVLIATVIIGLVAADRVLGAEGWPSILWRVSTVAAFFGLIVGKPFFSVALFGLAIVAVTRLHAFWTAAALAVGGGLWLYLFVVGVRIGDENGRPLTGAEEFIGVVAALLMGLGLIGLGLVALHRTDQTPSLAD